VEAALRCNNICMSGRSEKRSCRARRVCSALRAIQPCAASSSVMQVVLRDTTCFGLRAHVCLTKAPKAELRAVSQMSRDHAFRHEWRGERRRSAGVRG
jgi:hypothetical protein